MRIPNVSNSSFEVHMSCDNGLELLEGLTENALWKRL